MILRTYLNLRSLAGKVITTIPSLLLGGYDGVMAVADPMFPPGAAIAPMVLLEIVISPILLCTVWKGDEQNTHFIYIYATSMKNN